MLSIVILQGKQPDRKYCIDPARICHRAKKLITDDCSARYLTEEIVLGVHYKASKLVSGVTVCCCLVCHQVMRPVFVTLGSTAYKYMTSPGFGAGISWPSPVQCNIDTS
jgi:hypothetical protein